MDFGTRQIRTAGKGSGSVELTLPGELRRLVGLPCRILLHDGERPNIVLQPDLARARDAFGALWGALALALLGEPAPAFPAPAFSFGLLRRAGGADCPYLCWQDGLALGAGTATAEAVACSIAACAQQMAPDLAIAPSLAGPFGAVCGFTAIGRVAFPDWQVHCDVACVALSGHPAWHPGHAFAQAPDTRGDPFWAQLTPALCRVADVFAGWSQPGSAYPALRAAWRRGRSIELQQG